VALSCLITRFKTESGKARRWSWLPMRESARVGFSGSSAHFPRRSDYTRDPFVSFTFQPYLPHATPSTNATPAATGTPAEPAGPVQPGTSNGTAAPTLLPPQTIQGQKIHTYDSTNGSSSFWRFMLEVPLQEVEMAVRYRLNGGAEMEFVIPKRGQNFRWAAHSCNGAFGVFQTHTPPIRFPTVSRKAEHV
jgi:hypothetical protein